MGSRAGLETVTRRKISQSWSGCGGLKGNLCPCQELNPGHPFHSIVTILAELSNFLKYSHYHINYSFCMKHKGVGYIMLTLFTYIVILNN